MFHRKDDKSIAPKIRMDQSQLKSFMGSIVGMMKPMDALKKLKDDMLKGMKKALAQETYSDVAKKALSKALTIKVEPSGLHITAHHPAWGFLIEGRKRRQMTWLVKAKAPIPIITESGKLIFRSATAKSMADGKWVHPGRPKGGYTDQARKYAYDFLQKRLGKEFLRTSK